MKILVTGGAGFIGSHIVDGYIKRGYDVITIDDLSTGKKTYINKEAKFVKGDITKKEDLERVFDDFGPFDLVNHHAAQKSVCASIDNPIRDADINIMGSLNLLETMRQYGCHRVIFASSGGALYGDTSNGPASESSPIKLGFPYAVSKHAIEEYLAVYGGMGIITQVLRYSNVYGPRQDPEGEAGVVAIFCNNAVKGENLCVYGDGQQTRDFIYVDDVVSANIALSNYLSPGIWNVSTGHEISISSLAQIIWGASKIIGCKPLRIDHRKRRSGEVRISVLSAQKAKKDLNWAPRVELQDGIMMVLSGVIKQEGLRMPEGIWTESRPGN